jgi:hypothetical protein
MPGRNAKFYDLTYLYPGPGTEKYIIPPDEENEYNNIIRNELKRGKYIDGDLLYIGTTYETRPEYGFATVTNNGTDFIDSEYPIMNTPGVYYREAMKEIDNFWSGNQGMGMREPYFNEDDVLDLRNTGRYEHPSENWKSLLSGAKKSSKKMIRNRVYSDEVMKMPKNVSDLIARNTVFGKKRVNSEIVYLKKFV